MPNTIQRLLFPETFRDLPHRRLLLNTLRSIHIASFCVLVGGVFFSQHREAISVWLLATVTSGVAMFLVDLYGSCIALFEVRGISILIKIMALSRIPFVAQDQQMIILFAVIIFSSFISHSTRRIRHKNFMPTSFKQKFSPLQPGRNSKTSP